MSALAILALGSVLCTLVGVVCWKDGRNQGYDKGRKYGYDEGWVDSMLAHARQEAAKRDKRGRFKRRESA